MSEPHRRITLVKQERIKMSHRIWKRIALAVIVAAALPGFYILSFDPVLFVCDKLQLHGTPVGRTVDVIYAPLYRWFWGDAFGSSPSKSPLEKKKPSG